MAGKPFRAAYDGRCAECGDEIVADLDDIVMTDDGAVHADCAPEVDEELTATFDL